MERTDEYEEEYLQKYQRAVRLFPQVYIAGGTAVWEPTLSEMIITGFGTYTTASYHLIESSAYENIMHQLKNIEEKVEFLINKISTVSIALNTLNSDTWSLAKPLIINFEQRDEEEFVACFYEANIYGYGNSIPEAIEDFQLALTYQFEDLLQDKEEILGPMPQKQLTILKDIIIPKST